MRPPDYPTKTYIEKNAALYGEAVKPVGYDTCPGVYPESAYKHAEEIKARASGKSSLYVKGGSSFVTSLFASSRGAASQPAGQASSPSALPVYGAVVALLAAGVLGTTYMKRRAELAPRGEFTPAETTDTVYTAM